MSEQQSERFARYKLTELIPESDWMYLDRVLHILTQVRVCPRDLCMLIEQQRLTSQEFTLIRELLSHHPNYAPHENLLAVLNEETVERSRKQLYRAMEHNDVEPIMRPLRNRLHYCRMKILPFHIDIRPVLETGYMLMPEMVGMRHVGGVA